MTDNLDKLNGIEIVYDDKVDGQIISPVEWNANFYVIEQTINDYRYSLNANTSKIENVGSKYIGVEHIPGIEVAKLQEVLVQLKAMIDDRYSKESIDAKILELSNALTALIEQRELIAVTDTHIKDVTYDSETGKFTFVKQGSEQESVVIDTLLEKVILGFEYDAEREVLIFTDSTGATYEVDISQMVSANEFEDTETIGFIVNGNSAKAFIRDGSISAEKLSFQLVSEIAMNKYVSEGYAKGTQEGIPVVEGQLYYQDNAKYYCEQAGTSAQNAASSASAAESAKSESVLASTAAQGSAQTAEAAKNIASSASATARTKAAEAAEYAEQAQAAASTAMGFDYQGVWDSNATYTQGQLVTYNATMWTALRDNLNSVPYESSQDWGVFVGLPPILDLGDFDTEISNHMFAPDAHSGAIFDANNSEATTQATLTEHESAEDAHGNIVIDGNGGM